ncbi:hypothetical protein AYI70_g9335 [Smittium culicis]|uniref:Uncharacterized protein n=1 Tax=Smittium culicis TaxID=133412 RepID=A0A1R1XBN9_9FUNG|nr:hypothetical protein AYI70_g9789 [Smittium culicis]OMJ12062.1 hypothetical protein AYI70_g9335 [Smittium culicis]
MHNYSKPVDGNSDGGDIEMGNSGLSNEGKAEPSFSEEQIRKGSELIEKFMMEFSKTDGIAEMSRENLCNVVEGLKSKYKQEIESNEYLQYVISSF